MEFIEQNIRWVFLIKWNLFHDERGSFLKVLNYDLFLKKWLHIDFKECYFSISKKWVIRWMHFQNPPDDHEKLVYVSKWSIVDVLLDIRKNSPTFWKFLTLDLSFLNWYYVYIPRWIAHWFQSLEDDTIVNYMQTSCYSKDNDNWIMYNSFWYNWENIENSILSQRDLSFSWFEKFNSPF